MFEGKVAQSVYDPASGRLSARRFFDNLTQYNAGTPSETWTYKHDAFGRETEVRQQVGAAVRTTTTAYDEQGRVKSIASPEGTINYRYDALGRKTRMFTGSAANPTNDVSYSYDALSRLTAVEVHERNNVVLSTPERTSYLYDLVGNLDLQRKPGGVVDDFVYDALNRLDTLTTFKDVGDDNAYTTGVDRLLAEYDYTVRADGRRTAAVERFWWDDGADGLWDPHENRLTWIYDNALDQTERFVYDLVGNRRTQTLDRGNNGSIDETTEYAYDANDRLTTETAGAKVTSYSYTHTQQWVKEVRESGTLTSRSEYMYDLQGRMESATVTSYTSGVASRIERTTFDYNDAGIRISALHETDADANGTYETATRTEYLNDPANPTGYSQVLQETVTDPATGEIQKRVVYAVGLDQIVQTTTAYSGGEPQSSETLVFNADGHGSTRLLTDLAGAILTLSGVRQLFAYDAYGNALGFDPAQAATAFLYSGEQFDASLGLQYLRARYYDPATGRFNRLDPFFGNLQDPQSLHKYLYTHGDPIGGTDPTGMMELGAFSLSGVMAVLGAVPIAEGDDWDFTRAEYRSLVARGRDFSFGPDSAWFPKQLQDNLNRTLVFVLTSRDPIRSLGVNVEDFFHGHFVVPRNRLTEALRTSRRDFDKRRGDILARALGGQDYDPVTPQNIGAFSDALKEIERLATPLLEQALTIQGAAVIYHTFEHNIPEGMRFGSPVRNILTGIGKDPQGYDPSGRELSATQFMDEYFIVLDFGFLVDAHGMIHVTWGSDRELAKVTGKPME